MLHLIDDIAEHMCRHPEMEHLFRQAERMALLLVGFGVCCLVVVLLAGICAILHGASRAADVSAGVLLALGGVVAAHLAFAHGKPPFGMGG
jgi:hypothetical protein